MPQFDSYLVRLRELDFVRNVVYAPTAAVADHGHDGELRIATPKGVYKFIVERKNSYLDRSLLHSIIARARHHSDHHQKLLLLARYVPLPSAELLVRSRVNFLDLAGNIHLQMGSDYNHTVIGNKETHDLTHAKPLTAAKIQLLFTLASDVESSHLTVRNLSAISGLGKSNVAQMLNQLVDQKLLRKTGAGLSLPPVEKIEDYLVHGYTQVLRPKLFLKRVRPMQTSMEKTYDELFHACQRYSIRCSMTGGNASYQLQHFYKGPELTIFMDDIRDALLREVRFLPDRNGPVTLLRGFGAACYWREVQGRTLAHPWLIYSELLYSSDARAHEAALELKRGFLKP